jgi:hypothetical protein
MLLLITDTSYRCNTNKVTRFQKAWLGQKGFDELLESLWKAFQLDTNIENS